jgi:hypothetical protein
MPNSHYYGFEPETTIGAQVNPTFLTKTLGLKRQRRRRVFDWTEEVYCRVGKNREGETVTYIYGLRWDCEK